MTTRIDRIRSLIASEEELILALLRVRVSKAGQPLWQAWVSDELDQSISLMVTLTGNLARLEAEQ